MTMKSMDGNIAEVPFDTQTVHWPSDQPIRLLSSKCTEVGPFAARDLLNRRQETDEEKMDNGLQELIEVLPRKIGS